ncbi:hypothetical protein U1Q18_022860, partial [Sarracenia purpurea var. burkii]
FTASVPVGNLSGWADSGFLVVSGSHFSGSSSRFSGSSGSSASLVRALLWFTRFSVLLLLIWLVFGILLISSLVRLRAATLWFGDLSGRANPGFLRFWFATSLVEFSGLVVLLGYRNSLPFDSRVSRLYGWDLSCSLL